MNGSNQRGGNGGSRQRSRGRWNNRFSGRWRGSGGSGGRGWNRGWRGGSWRGRGGAERGGSFERSGQRVPSSTQPVHNQSQEFNLTDDSEVGPVMALSAATPAHTIDLSDARAFWRPFLIGFDLTPSETQINAAKMFLCRNDSTVDQADGNDFRLDYKKLTADEELLKDWPTFKTDIDKKTQSVIGTFCMAQHQLDKEVHGETALVRQPHLKGLPTLTNIRDIRTSTLGQLVSVSATVIRVSNVRPICSWMTFQCDKCFTFMSTEQPYGRYQLPEKCVTPKCRSKSFIPQRDHDQTLTVSWQGIRLQEVLFSESGRVPRTIDAELTNHLCDVVGPSDVVNIVGVVKAAPIVSDQKSGPVYSLYIHALSLDCVNSLKSNSDQLPSDFSEKDHELIREVYNEGDSLFKLLVSSLAPTIYGHEMVKAGLILGLFGGSQRQLSNKSTHIPVRSDPHILVVGDPGLGKSQLLLACANVAPRGAFITASGVTTSGLTVSLSKEPGNEFVLEAGALVMADRGCCCIDELDKMSSQHNALLEAMEQQSVSIAKSGLVCSLPARTTILAAANPVGGHYNKARTVSENIKINPALLSRFDLVFILVDKPNEELDAMMSDHIMQIHTKRDDRDAVSTSLSLSTSMTSSAAKVPTAGPSGSLKERLRKYPGEVLDVLPHELMRKYIAYAKQYVHPKLSSEACNVIQKFYLELRNKYQNSESTPITLRQLESLIRLTEARAKLQLKEIATEQDAKDVVFIMKETMVDVFTDELGFLDFTRAPNGAGMSGRSAAKRFISFLQRYAHSQQKSLFSLDELKKLLSTSGVKVDNFRDLLDSLNLHGYLIKRSGGLFKIADVDY